MKQKLLKFILIATCLILGLCNVVNAQAPNYIWAKSSVAADGDASGTCISTDANGNSVVTGYFGDATITFGAITLTNSKKGKYDFFIVKYDSSGNVLWAKSAGGTDNDMGISVSTDDNGSIYVTGTFKSPTIKFGTNTFKNNYSNCDLIFIVKYDSLGNVIWAKSAGSAISAASTSITVGDDNKIYLTGYFGYSSITFGTITLTNKLAGPTDIFIVKYDSSGNVDWAKSAGGTSGDIANSISLDASCNIYITGWFWSKTIVLGKTTLTRTPKTGTLDCCDLFTVKLDSSGNILWAKSAGGNNYDWGTSISTDASGKILMVGRFNSDSIQFGKTTLINTALKFGFAGGDDIFIVKYDSSGNIIWVKTGYGIGNENCNSIITDVKCNIYIGGSFSSDTIILGTKSLINGGSIDMFLAKLDSNGNFLWAAKAAETIYPSQMTTYNSANSVSSDAKHNIYFTGYFDNPSITLGTITLTNSSTNGAHLVLIAKLDSSTISPSATNIDKIQYWEDLKIAPNPFTTYTIITFSEIQKNTLIKIIDAVGKEVKSQTFSGKELIVEKGIMKEGIYFLQITDEKNNVITKKILVN